jgi:hypothetical protein
MDAPPPTPTSEIKEYKNNYYNCTQCSSLIEISSINVENNKIEFKCCNDEHEKQTMKIKAYLDTMKFNNKEQLNKDRCEIHDNNKYKCYCFDCNCHLCEECLKTRTHINHQKNLIIEIKPVEEELEIMEEIIK